MEYEVIRSVNKEQLKRIQDEFNRFYNPDNLMLVKANGIEIGFGVVFFICGHLTKKYYLFKYFKKKRYCFFFF